MTQVVNYKNFKVEQTHVNVPEKTKGKYFSYVSKEKYPLLIQSPVLTIQKIENNDIHFLVKKNGSFSNIIQQFDDFCINYITDHTTEFFNGKKFSKAKILSSYQSSLQSFTDDNDILIAHVTNPDQLIIRDQRNNSRSYDDLEPGNEIIAIFEFEGILFKKDSMRLSCTVKQMKVYISESLKNWCIEQDDDEYVSSDIDFTNREDIKEIEAQIKSLEEIAKETSVEISSVDQQQDNETELNDDDKDLF